jgi:hypothetical protein
MVWFCFVFEPFSELQGSGLNEKFLHCCEKWVQLLEKVEALLKGDIANNLPALLEQQKTFEVNLCPLLSLIFAGTGKHQD